MPKTRVETPQARADLLLRELDGETLIYDFSTHRAHCLNATARAVFARCDGRTPIAELARVASAQLAQPVSEELVQVALDELAEAGLLCEARPRAVDRARRRVLGQLALTASAAVAIPAVWSIVAPTRADAASRVSCTSFGNCPNVMDGTCCGTSGSAAMTCSAGMCGNNGNFSQCMDAFCK